MIEFLTPLGWLVAAAALVPIGAAVLRTRREAAVRRRIALIPPRRIAQVSTATAAALALALLAAAAARPAVRTSEARGLRTDAQVYFVVDITRSMLARLPHGVTRYARALAAAERLRTKLADVPVGIASLTDRPLPHLFPTGDRRIFSAVLHRAIGIERPPPEGGRAVSGVATNFDPLGQLATAGYFRSGVQHKLAILFTDGESNLYSPRTLARELRTRHVDLLIVRFWNPDERVYASGGRVETYRPNPSALLPLRALAAGVGGGLYQEGQVKQVVRAARARLGHGPTRPVGTPGRFELAPYTALAAVLPIAFVLWRRDPR